jgi:elongation of very long chain fatty acids protein 6
VVHKKKLILLHWYHHASVLLASWHTMVTHSPAGIIYTTVNYGVHAIMYLYYFLMAVKCKPKWFRPQWITIAQISQMVVGCIISICAFSLVHREDCWAKFENNTGILVMYASYFLLFSQFFLNRFGLGINVSGGSMNNNTDDASSKKKVT